MIPDVPRAVALLDQLDADLKASSPAQFSASLVRGRLCPIRAALNPTPVEDGPLPGQGELDLGGAA